MAFLTSRSASKHDIFALGVDPTARDAGKGGGSDLVSQGSCSVQGESRITSHLHHIATSDIASTDVGPGLV